jgi:hypothetical protein
VNDPTILAIGVAAALLLLIFILQTRRLSRAWLRWLPASLRDMIDTYFEAPPALHPDAPDPNQITADADAASHDQRIAAVLRHLFSFAHGLRDVEHYLIRFAIAFVIAAAKALALAAFVMTLASL